MNPSPQEPRPNAPSRESQHKGPLPFYVFWEGLIRTIGNSFVGFCVLIVLVIAAIVPIFSRSLNQTTQSTVVWLTFVTLMFLALVVAATTTSARASDTGDPAKNQGNIITRYLYGAGAVLTLFCAGYAAGSYRTNAVWHELIYPKYENVTGDIETTAQDLVVEPNEIIICKGRVNGMQSGIKLWLAVYSNGYLWPRHAPVRVDGNGYWNGYVQEEFSQQFEIVLLSTDLIGDAYIKNWIDDGQRHPRHNYDQISKFPNTAEVIKFGAIRLAKK